MELKISRKSIKEMSGIIRSSIIEIAVKVKKNALADIENIRENR
jgi:hypothetical protein